MVITEYRTHVEHEETVASPLVADEPRVTLAVAEAMDEEDGPGPVDGHCWDGVVCHHLDHGDHGTIHFIR
jgi:hypothetical protein